MAEEEKTKIAERYKKLETKRTEVLARARECVKLSIPSLLPPEGADETTVLYKPFQSLGARGVNNLASKLMMTLMPPNSPFFKFTVDPDLVAETGQDDTAVDLQLADMESVVTQAIEASGERVPTYQFIRLLITTGNALLYFPEEDRGGGMKVYRLDQYVIERDPLGFVLEIIIKEKIAPQAITDDVVKQKVLANLKKQENSKTYVELYTRAVLDKATGKWNMSQEAQGEELTDATGEYEKEDFPYLPLRWNSLANENYGRSHVDEAIGDLRALEGLSQARLEGASASAKVLIFVDPNGTTRSTDVSKAENLEVIEGRADEVTSFQLEKNSDLAVVRESINDLKTEIAYHFLLNSSIQRNAERVTAEEIRTMAGELENGLGGTYTVLSQEFQLPYIRIKMARMKKAGVLPEGSEKIDPVITTGLDGLGRGHDYNRLNTFIMGAKALGPKAEEKVNYTNALNQLAISLGLKPEDVVMSTEDQQAVKEEEQANEMMKGATGPIAGQVAKSMGEGMPQGEIPPQ